MTSKTVLSFPTQLVAPRDPAVLKAMISPGAKIDSDFALLDVKKGRASISKALAKLPEGQRVKVVITGYFDNDIRAHGNDDGVSREFCIDVESVEVAP